jgi:hypothetical protein
VLAKVSFDRGLEVDQRAEGAASQAPAGERGEKALDAVRPGARSGLEMKCPARVPGEPGRYLIRMLVDGVVVEDRMNQPTTTLCRGAQRLRRRTDRPCMAPPSAPGFIRFLNRIKGRRVRRQRGGCARVPRGAYRAQPSRRRHIPKPDGRQRPLAIASLPIMVGGNSSSRPPQAASAASSRMASARRISCASCRTMPH